MKHIENDLPRILRGMAARLATPAAWCQGPVSYTRGGEPVSPLANAAACWCISGAAQIAIHADGVRHHDWPGYTAAAYRAIADAICAVDPRFAREPHVRDWRALGVHAHLLAAWNDAPERQHADILAVCRQLTGESPPMALVRFDIETPYDRESFDPDVYEDLLSCAQQGQCESYVRDFRSAYHVECTDAFLLALADLFGGEYVVEDREDWIDRAVWHAACELRENGFLAPMDW